MQVGNCGQELAKRDVRNLKSLDQHIKELKHYERALQGLGCDREIESNKRQLFESLTDTILEVHEDIEAEVKKSNWDAVAKLKKYLERSCPILESSELTSEAEKRHYVERFNKMNENIQAKAHGLTCKLALIQSFDLKDPLKISPHDLREFLSEIEKEGQLLGGKLVQNFVTQEISKEKIIRDLKAKIQLADREVQILWDTKNYKTIFDLFHLLEGMCTVEALEPESSKVYKSSQEDLKIKLDGLARNCLDQFKQAANGKEASKDMVRQNFKAANAYLEEIQQCQKNLGALTRICSANMEDDVVKVMMEATDGIVERFRRDEYCVQMEDVVSAVLDLWTIPSEISNHKVKAHASANIAEIFERCRKEKKAEFNFSDLAARLSRADPKGGEIVHDFGGTFKEYQTMKFREATARMTIEDSLDKLAELNSLSNDQKETLRNSYTAFHTRFCDLLKTKTTLEDFADLVPRHESAVLRHKCIPELVAAIFAAWSMSISDKTTESSAWPSPHPIQVLSIYRLLGVGSPKRPKSGFWLDTLYKVGDYFSAKSSKADAGRGHLIELKTGEGKSLVLAVLSTVLAIFGFRVDCVCYSQYLSIRDWCAVEQIFELFGVKDRVKYDTFTSLSKRLINSVCDVREGTKSFISGGACSNICSGDDRDKKILLIDEVDVFFSKDFYGMVYSASSHFVNPQVEAIQRLVWKHRALTTREIIGRVKENEAYSQLIAACKGVVALIDAHILCMAEDVKLFESKDQLYQVDKEGKIVYKTHDTTSSNVVYRYKTLFAYFKECERGLVSEACLKAALGLHISCGNFSYAEIPHCYDQILGVTGTLESLGEFEKNVIQSVYGIRDKTVTPSIYGDSQLTFREVIDVHVEPDSAQYNRKIKEEILAATGQGRPVMIFFENEGQLQDWLKSGYAEGIENMCHVTSHTENIDHYVMQATRARSVTLFTAVHCRGLDFVCHDMAVEAAGGVHVVQAFLSEQLSEEIQTRGRTARQGKKGTFKLVVLASNLDRFGLSGDELEEARRSGTIYQLLHNKRSAWFTAESTHRQQDVESARELHQRSITFQKHLLSYDSAVSGERRVPEAVIQGICEALLEFNSNGTLGAGGDVLCRLMCLSDATQSMEKLWTSTKQHIQTMLRRIEELAGAGRVELKWVAYRDYDVPDSLLQCSAWTTDAKDLLAFIDGVRCFGGGDYEEAVEAALALANRDESPPTRVLLIGDAPPHVEKAGQKLKHHSHVLDTDWEKECKELTRKGIQLYTFQVLTI